METIVTKSTFGAQFTQDTTKDIGVFTDVMGITVEGDKAVQKMKDV